MSFKDILVYLHNEQPLAHLDLAITLAKAHGARLTGLHVLLSVVQSYAISEFQGAVVDAQMESERVQAQLIEDKFRAQTAAAGLDAEWKCVEGDPPTQLTLHARYADVVVVSNFRDHSILTANAYFLDKTLLATGRPVIVAPDVDAFDGAAPGRRILLAWNESRESARALNDSMLLLKQAERVDIVTINPADKNYGMACQDLYEHLCRHDIPAVVHPQEHDRRSIGQQLLGYAETSQADLLIMGAYGHSRWREIVLGGVTKHILKHATLPVLMSH